MSRIALATWDGGGNVPPLLHVGIELQARGHEVRVLGHAAQQPRFDAAGLSFVPYRHALPWSRTDPFDDLAIFERFADGGAGQDMAELVAAWNPDAAVIDCLMLGPLQAAQAQGLPTLALFHSFWAFFGEAFPQGPITEMAAPHGREPTKLWEAATEVLVTSDRELDPVQAEIPPNVHWTGVAQRAALPALRDDRSRVLLSLSTVWFPSQQESIQRILEAVGDLPIRVVATIDSNIAADRLQIPANVEAHAYVDHAEIMPTVAAVIGHGGHATTMFALAHGLPVLVIPQHPMLDQPMFGQILAARGAGLAVTQHPEVEEIQRAVTALLQDDSFAAGADAIGKRLREENGVDAAASRIEAVVGAGVTV